MEFRLEQVSIRHLKKRTALCFRIVDRLCWTYKHGTSYPIANGDWTTIENRNTHGGWSYQKSGLTLSDIGVKLGSG